MVMNGADEKAPAELGLGDTCTASPHGDLPPGSG